MADSLLTFLATLLSSLQKYDTVPVWNRAVTMANLPRTCGHCHGYGRSKVRSLHLGCACRIPYHRRWYSTLSNVSIMDFSSSLDTTINCGRNWIRNVVSWSL